MYVEYIKWERLARSPTGFLVPYHCLEVNRVHHAARFSRYVPINPLLEALECCRDMLVDITFVVTYCGSRLICDPSSGLRVVLLTE